jgi:hypothetical protein
MNTETIADRRTPVWRRLARVLKRALLMELRIYASIARWIGRRPAIPRNAVGVSYHKPVLTILIIFIVLSAVEIPIIDLIARQWPPVRIFFLILGIWGVTWMVGLLCAYLTRPHTVGADGIQVRNGLEVNVPLSWDDIAAVKRDHRVDQDKLPKIVESDGSRTLMIHINRETNIEIELERPTAVRLPGQGKFGGEQSVTIVRLWADEPRRFLDEVRKHI